MCGFPDGEYEIHHMLEMVGISPNYMYISSTPELVIAPSPAWFQSAEGVTKGGGGF